MLTITDWAVVGGAAAAIAWVNWYFFLAERPSGHATATDGGVQEVGVPVKGGHTQNGDASRT
jgi:plastocyanin domain-containing protein